MSAGFNIWGVDPRILVNLPFGRNMLFVGLFLMAQILGLAGAILMLQKARLGFVLSIAHHLLHLPALVITSVGLVMLMDDRINVTLLFMSKPAGSDVGFYWSLGWSSVFSQVTRNVPTGSTFLGMNLFAFACATCLWIGMDELDAEQAEEDEDDMDMRRPRQATRAQLALPPPLAQPYPQRPLPQQGGRQPPRVPPPQGPRQPPRAPQRGGRDRDYRM
jgi:hypothetical protein